MELTKKLAISDAVDQVKTEWIATLTKSPQTAVEGKDKKKGQLKILYQTTIDLTKNTKNHLLIKNEFLRCFHILQEQRLQIC